MTQIRSDLQDSPVSLQLYQKFLFSINILYEKYSQNLDIRFHSLLRLLSEVAKFWAILHVYYHHITALNKQGQAYYRKHDQYKMLKEAYDSRMAPQSRDDIGQHLNDLVGDNEQKLVEPEEPQKPAQVLIKDALNSVPRLFLLHLFYDYLDVFNEIFTRTGSSNWFKALTLKQIQIIECKLRS